MKKILIPSDGEMAKSVDVDHHGAPVLTTERLCLRGWEDGDFAPYLDLVSDSERMRYVGAGAMTIAQAQNEYREMRDQWITRGIGVFVIAKRENHKSLGFTGLFESPMLDEPELCWSLFPGCEGMGYASEAAALARDWSYRERDIGPLMSLVHPENYPSRAVAERLGASIERESTWLGKPRFVYRHVVPV